MLKFIFMRRRIRYMRYMRILYFVLAIFFIVYVVIPLAFRFSPSLQRHFIFRHDVSLPAGLSFSDPDKQGISGTYNRYLRVGSHIQLGVWHIVPADSISEIPTLSDKMRNTWFLEQLGDSRPVVIYCHGNTPSRATPHRIMLYHILQKLNFHVIAFDYRGFADSSEVIPTEDGLVEDAVEVIKWTRNYSNSLLIVWGHSLGTGVATKAVGNLCSTSREHCPDGLILQAPFSSIADEFNTAYVTMLFRILPWFESMFVSPLSSTGIVFNNSRNIREVTCPILIMHAEDDYVVPFALGKKLYEIGKKGRPPKFGFLKLVSFSHENGYGHNHLYKAPELPTVIKNFFTEAARFKAT